ncbi:MAG: ATP-binding protein [Raineya sp.]|jgi:signal transduction histidine kinase|nr:ATP-binding protein [Raineya sp.]
MQSILKRLFNIAHLNIEEKVFIYIIRLTLFLVLIAIPINFYINFTFLAWVCVGVLLLNIFWYYLAFGLGHFKVAVIGYSLITVIFLTWFWFLNGGIEGRIGIFYVVLSMIFAIILPRKIQTYGVIMICIIILIVVIIEYKYPYLVDLHQTKEDKIIDLTLTYITLAYGAFFVMSVLKSSYDQKQRKIDLKDVEILKQNEVLEQNSLELSRQNEQLQKMNASQHRLFSIIAHDLRSPLTSSKAIVELVYQKNMPVEQLQEVVPEMYRNLSYTLSLVDNLLFWAKSQFGDNFIHLEPIELNSYIESQIADLEIIATYKNIHFEVSLEKTKNVIIGFDRQILEIALRNLISNAVKFSHENSPICIQTTINNDNLQIKVIDSGMGMSLEHLENIRKGIVFSSKGTNYEKGTGLGLNLCQGLLKKCNSTLEIESIEQKGTTVSIIIPLDMLY